jgi:hypothetical protein
MHIIAPLLFILFILLSIYRVWYNSARQKGKRGEKQVSSYLSQLSEEYTILNDVVFRTEKGTTQIDHIVVSKYGIFTIETKNYRGEIYGGDNRQEWTQLIITKIRYPKKWWKTYTYVTKNHLYNPVKQSIGHALRIKELLSAFPYVKIVPIVVFTGDAKINNINSNHHVVYKKKLLSVIDGYKSIYLNDKDVLKVIEILRSNNVREEVNDRKHVKNLRAAEKEFNSSIKAGICPKCGGYLIERNGKFGSFYGCSNYPKCKFTTQ